MACTRRIRPARCRQDHADLAEEKDQAGANGGRLGVGLPAAGQASLRQRPPHPQEFLHQASAIPGEAHVVNDEGNPPDRRDRGQKIKSPGPQPCSTDVLEPTHGTASLLVSNPDAQESKREAEDCGRRK